MSNLEERLNAMADTVGVKATLKAIARVGEMDKKADKKGLASKGRPGVFDGVGNDEIDVMLADLEAEKGRRGDTLTHAAAPASVDLATQVATAVKEAMGPMMTQLEALVTNRTTEQVTKEREAVKLSAQIAELQKKLNAVESGQKELQNEVTLPRAFNGTYRPSTDNQPLPEAQQTQQKGQQTAVDQVVKGLAQGGVK